MRSAEIVELALHLASEHRERRGVHLDAGALDVSQHGNERLFQLAVDGGQAFALDVLHEGRAPW